MTYKNENISVYGDPALPPWEWTVRQSGKMNVEAMRHNLLDFKRTMDSNGIVFVLTFGSLLGAVRNKDVIENDSDADVFCFTKDYLKWQPTKEMLRSDGFYIPETHPLHDDFLIRDGEKIDVWWMCPFGKFYVYDDSHYYPRTYLDNLTTITLFGESFYIPQNAEKFLEELYGASWRTPSNTKCKMNIYEK